MLAQMASAEDAAAAYKTGKAAAPELSFPKKYTAADTSDKEVEVKPGSNDVKIEISGT